MAEVEAEVLAPTEPQTLKPSHSRKLIRRGPTGSKTDLKADDAAPSTSETPIGCSEGDSVNILAKSGKLIDNDVEYEVETTEKPETVEEKAAADQLGTSPLDSEVTEPETGLLDETELKLEQEANRVEVQTLEQLEAGDDTAYVHVWPAPLQEDEKSLPGLDSVGPEVEEWVRAEKKISIRTVTWNLCARAPPPIEAATTLLLPRNRYHLYVIGTEECERSIAQSAINPSKKAWEAYLTEALGDNYVPVKAHTLQAIHLMVFAHKGIAHLCSAVTSGAVPTGIGNTLGNKGGVAISFLVGNTKVALVNVHLAAHQNAVKRRNVEFNKLHEDLPVVLDKKVKKMSSNKRPSVSHKSEGLNEEDKVAPAARANAFPQEPSSVSSEADVAHTSGDSATLGEKEVPATFISRKEPPSMTLNEYADRVIFMGDMNYRVRGTRSAVDKLLDRDMHDVMLNNDQLIWSMRNDLVPAQYVEPPLHFKPTYKFDLGSDIYDSGSKGRIPAWCDRVLYIERGLQCMAYNADTSLKTSDHRPVFATFLADVAFEEGDGATDGAPAHESGHPEFSSESQVCSIM